MPCTKDEFVTAINSYSAARATGDVALTKMAAAQLNVLLETLSFTEPEPADTDGSQE